MTLKEHFNSNYSICESNEELQKAIKNSNEKIQFYNDHEYIDIDNIDKDLEYLNNIFVENMETIAAANKLLELGCERIAVLDFANQHYIGGGSKRNVAGQEEYLCRNTTLYCSLESSEASKYYNDRSISAMYIPEVQLLRQNIDTPYYDRPITADVIVSASMIDLPINKMLAVSAACVTENQYQFHLMRSETILRLALHNNVDGLVLGAFGCGSSNNNPYSVATAYEDILKEYSKYFKFIIFAVYDLSTTQETYSIFKNILVDKKKGGENG